MEPVSVKPAYFIVTYGCQMNKNDSERIGSILSQLGFHETDVIEHADFILLNTCSVRQSAEDRVFGKMADIIRLKELNPKLIVAVTGCMAGRDKKGEFRKRLSVVDLYFPTPDMVHLPKWIAELRPDLVNSSDYEKDYLKIRPVRAPSVQAYVTIQTGCNKFCTYCVVPYARGLEINRPVKDILDEIHELVDHGIIEITLLGQTVNSFRAKDPEHFSTDNPYKDHFAALLWEVNNIRGIRRVHWTAPHPNSMTDEVIDALALPKQLNYLHLPVQAGSNEVLQRMNRKYTREKFLEVIQKINARRPGIALGTDIIVGFPGETEEQFNETISLYKECDFDIAYTAQYSPRSGTLGVKLYTDDVTPEEKRRRWDILQELMLTTTKRKNQAYLGTTVEVLVERVENGLGYGNTQDMKLARFSNAETKDIGTIIPVKITQALEWQLIGDRM